MKSTHALAMQPKDCKMIVSADTVDRFDAHVRKSAKAHSNHAAIAHCSFPVCVPFGTKPKGYFDEL